MHHTCSVAAHLTVADWVLGAEEMKGRERIWKCYEHAAKNMFYLFAHSGKNEKNHVLWSHERWGPTHWLHAFSLHCAVGKLVIHFNENALSSERWFSNLFLFRKKKILFSAKLGVQNIRYYLKIITFHPWTLSQGEYQQFAMLWEKKDHNCEKNSLQVRRRQENAHTSNQGPPHVQPRIKNRIAARKLSRLTTVQPRTLTI